AEPPYTALSGGSRVVVVLAKGGEDATGLLARLGMAMLHFRSYGRRTREGHLVGDVLALQWFLNDHDNMWDVATGGAGRDVPAPRRVAFGLPHNYYFRSAGPKGTKVDVTAAEYTRRASPLSFHVHQPPEGRPLAVVSFLPARFLPGDQPKLLISRGM